MAEDKKTPLEKLNDNIDALTIEKDDDEIPAQLSLLLAIINNVDAEQMRKDLAGAVMEKIDDPDNPGKKKKVQKYADSDGEIVGEASDDDIVVEAKGDTPAKTVKDLIDSSIGPHLAMAKLMDKYITLMLNARIGEPESG